jgi:hypothetical protein
MYTGFSRFDGRLFPVVVVKLADELLAVGDRCRAGEASAWLSGG